MPFRASSVLFWGFRALKQFELYSVWYQCKVTQWETAVLEASVQLKAHEEFSTCVCFYVSFPRWIFFDNCFRTRTKILLCSFWSHVCKWWAAGACDGFILCWLVHAVVLCSLSWIYTTISEQHGVKEKLLCSQQTFFGSCCREIRRKLCLIFVLLCMVFPVTLPCYFRNIPRLDLGDPGVVTQRHSFTSVHSFTAALLTGFPSLFLTEDFS